MHVISHSFASLMNLVSLDETTLNWVVFFELKISRGFIVTQDWSDSEIFWTCIENNLSALWDRWPHMDSSKINSIVLGIKRHLKLQIIFIVNWGISLLADQLCHMNMSVRSSLTFNLSLSLHHIIIFWVLNIDIDGLGILSQICRILLSSSLVMSSLNLS